MKCKLVPSSAIFLVIAFPLCVKGQLPGTQTLFAEDILHEDAGAGVVEEIGDAYLELVQNPVDLNEAAVEELEASGLFTAFQVHQLIRYRKRYGRLYSVYELAGIPGFRVSRLRKISPYLTTGIGSPARPVSHTRNSAVCRLRASFPVPEGYSAGNTGGLPPYAASPIQLSLRLRYGTEMFSMGFAYEKDAGEPFLEGYRPQFFSGFLVYRRPHTVKEIVAGSFRLQHGMGLVNGSGFLHSATGYIASSPVTDRLKPYASTCESGMKSGIACLLGGEMVHCRLWSSYRPVDLSLNNLPANLNGVDWTTMERRTGLHRTQTEIAGRSMAYVFNSGIRISLRKSKVHLGVLYETGVSNLTSRGRDSLQTAPSCHVSHAGSLSWHWFSGRTELFGEAATLNLTSAAILAGLRIPFNSFLHGLLLIHHYGRSYRGTIPSGYASGSKITNEQGFAIALHAEPGKHLLAELILEAFRYPGPRHLTLVPSAGWRSSLILQNPPDDRWQWKIRIRTRHRQSTPGSVQTGIRPLETRVVTTLDLRLIYQPASMLQWQTRVVCSTSGKKPPFKPGYAALQQAGIGLGNSWRIKLQFLVFNVSDWDGRIYLYEPGVQYEFNFPVCYGSGQRLTAVAAFKSAGKMKFSARVSIPTYFDRASIGSGHDKVEGPCKYHLALQVQRNL